MMPSRIGYDLTRLIGWTNLREQGWKYARYYVWRDTFGKFVCLFLGHNTYETENGLACRRCCKYIKSTNR